MNKNQKIALISIIAILIISVIVIGAMLYRPVHICKEILPYSDSNYCFALSTKLPKVRKQYKLKYSLIDRKNLEQIFTNIRDFQGETTSEMLQELTSPEILGDIDKRNQKIDDMVANFISLCEDALVDAENETRYHNRNKYSGNWINYNHVFDAVISEQNVAELKEVLKDAKENGVFPADMATRLRQFRALGTPYCEIDSLGSITDCDGNHLGVVSNVFKPLGTNNTSKTSFGDNASNKTVKSETITLEKAIAQYKKDYEMYGNPKVEYDDVGMPMTEPNYSNAGMPKSLALKGVSIICFEWANMGDKSRCTSKELNTIEKFFKENTDIDWNNETFDYEIIP